MSAFTELRTEDLVEIIRLHNRRAGFMETIADFDSSLEARIAALMEVSEIDREVEVIRTKYRAL